MANAIIFDLNKFLSHVLQIIKKMHSMLSLVLSRVLVYTYLALCVLKDWLVLHLVDKQGVCFPIGALPGGTDGGLRSGNRVCSDR